MNKNNDNFSVVIDKLHLLFNFKANDVEALKNHFSLSGYDLIYSDNAILNNNYKFTLQATNALGNTAFIVHYSNRQNPTISKLIIHNKALYSTTINAVFNSIAKLQLEDLRPCYLEIAIDSNDPYTSIYTYQKKKGKLIYNDDYEGLYFGKEKYRYTDTKETKYIWHKKNANKHTQLRIENKTEQLIAKPKPYITAFHARHGLDINKPIYRIELSIPLGEFIVSRNAVMIDTFNPDRLRYISLGQYNSMPDKIQHPTDIFRGEIENYNKFKYTDKGSITKSLRLDMRKLSNRDYLLTIFDYYAGNMVNYRRLVKPSIKKVELDYLVRVLVSNPKPKHRQSKVDVFKMAKQDIPFNELPCDSFDSVVDFDLIKDIPVDDSDIFDFDDNDFFGT